MNLITRFESKIKLIPETGCWIWTACLDRDGYGRITVYQPNKKSVGAHRFSWEWYKGPIPDGLCILHKCDVPACVNPNHLFLGTSIDNNKDRDSKQRGRWAAGECHGSRTKPESRARGSRNGNARLSDFDIIKIRADTRRQHVIAAEYGVHQTMISKIKRQAAWTHIKRSSR